MTFNPQPKAPKPIRDEKYRRLVASLPCFYCKVEGYSQAAHPNTDKAKGVKASDLDCFPLCADRVGIKGCHSRFDQYEIVGRRAMRPFECLAKIWTQTQIKEMT